MGDYAFDAVLVSRSGIRILILHLITLWVLLSIFFAFVIYAKRKKKLLHSTKRISPFYFHCMKTVINCFCIIWAFFYDFSIGKYVWRLPEKMSISAFLIGFLAIPGLIESAIQAVHEFKKIIRADE